MLFWLALGVSKNVEFRIFVEFKRKIHIRMQKRCIRIVGVRQSALSVAHKMPWRCRCHCSYNAFLAYPVEPTGCGAAHSKYCGKREHQCGDVVYVKTGTKPFTQNVYLSHFLEGHLSPLHSHLAQENRMFRKPCKINVSSTFKKNMSRDFIAFFLHPTASHVFKWKKVAYSLWLVFGP